ncbi:MAG: hypothetical protein RLZ81_1853 [Pseudomonadota bacterium]|jgi:hypothetical protein
MKAHNALRLLLIASTGLVAWLVGCASKPAPEPEPERSPVATQVPATQTAPLSQTPARAPEASMVHPSPSGATTALAYRRDAARHLYNQNRDRIFRGKLPPLLHAVGVLQVQVDGSGRVVGLSWMRAPKHAPDVIAEIERSVRAAAPFPAPVRLGRVTYTDTWLWDRSGHFQLDTLTEGQL